MNLIGLAPRVYGVGPAADRDEAEEHTYTEYIPELGNDDETDATEAISLKCRYLSTESI